MTNYMEYVTYAKAPAPPVYSEPQPVDLTDETMAIHTRNILSRMKQEKLDVLIVYADREHGTNFGYLTGFEPRFEEAVLVLHENGKAYLMLGNESLRMGQFSRIPAEVVHTPYFSLPNQPMGNTKTLAELVEDTGVKPGMGVGLAGWKMFTSGLEDNGLLFDVPYFIVDAVKRASGDSGRIRNAASLFIHPESGARVIVTANEIAHYEFGAALASAGMRRMLDELEPGKTELELADCMESFGQPNNVQTICAAGERFTNAVVAPRAKRVSVGDRFSSTIGYRGGLTSRSGYIVSSAEELPSEAADYLEAVARPYYAASVAWYEYMAIGRRGRDIYELIESVIPKSRYGWKLNPGHLTAGEEWMSSPIYPGSDIAVASGMLFQMDIIPSVPGYGGAGAEDGVAIADEALRAELARDYPEVWGRIQARRGYMTGVLGIRLHPEVLPLSNLNGYFRPYLLNKTCAFIAGRA